MTALAAIATTMQQGIKSSLEWEQMHTLAHPATTHIGKSARFCVASSATDTQSSLHTNKYFCYAAHCRPDTSIFLRSSQHFIRKMFTFSFWKYFHTKTNDARVQCSSEAKTKTKAHNLPHLKSGRGKYFILSFRPGAATNKQPTNGWL